MEGDAVNQKGRQHDKAERDPPVDHEQRPHEKMSHSDEWQHVSAVCQCADKLHGSLRQRCGRRRNEIQKRIEAKYQQR